MPLWYTSIIEEHLSVRNFAGIFDVSHMGRIVIEGPDASKFIEYLIPTHVSIQPIGISFYTLFLNEECNIIDDLIIIKKGENNYLLVTNAANTEKDLFHIKKYSQEFQIEIENLTESSTMLAIQGFYAINALQSYADIDLNQIKRFRNFDSVIGDSRATITRTGYTGEDGFEIIFHDTDSGNNSNKVIRLWNELTRRIKPCGLGARDSLRIEAGLPLYGSELDENINPIEADIHWVVSKDKQDYIGSKRFYKLASQKPQRLRRGLILKENIPRKGFKVTNKNEEIIGEITSGTFSPILRQGIALAYIDSQYEVNQRVNVIIRGSKTEANIVKPPFYDETKYGWRRTK
jgi:aminomethyltransferase